MGMLITIDPYFWLHDTPHRRVYVPSTKTLTAYYHLMMNMVYVYLAHSGAEFWYISFCSLFDYYYSLWSKIFDLYGILSLLLEKIYDLFYSLWSRIFYFCRPLYILLIKILQCSWLPLGDNQYSKSWPRCTWYWYFLFINLFKF